MSLQDKMGGRFYKTIEKYIGETILNYNYKLFLTILMIDHTIYLKETEVSAPDVGNGPKN